MDSFNIKELYSVTLKTTYPIEIGNRQLEKGETIAAFDNIQLANFQEIKNNYKATGGRNNLTLISWSSTKQVNLTLVQGIFSKRQLALMTNAKLITSSNPIAILNQRESLESNEDKVLELKHPFKIDDNYKLFIYDSITGEKIEYSIIDERHLLLDKSYQSVIVDYYFDYTSKYEVLSIGKSLTQGCLSLEGRTRVKDEITGQIKTGIIKIPKLQLVSNLSIRLGRNANPLVGQIDAIAYPKEIKDSTVMEILFLDDDIDSDI